MQFRRHRCVTRKVGPKHPLAGKFLYIPYMAQGSVELLSSVFRWMGIDSSPTPPSDARTLELGATCTNGDECYPAKVTFGDFLKIAERPGFDPKRTMFLMVSNDGPCRFGQYAPSLRKVIREAGHGDVQVLSLRGERGYSDLGDFGNAFLRSGWRALVCGDILRKLLLQTRPYETEPGAADHAFAESLQHLTEAMENSCSNADCQLHSLVESLLLARERFHAVPARYDDDRPLIGVVGEIFCRLNNFSNQDMVRRLEEHGAECWLSSMAEWIAYTNAEDVRNLRLSGRGWSWEMLKSKLRARIQHGDEKALLAPFAGDFLGYREPDIEEVLHLAHSYLPFGGAEGEMVLSMGRSAHMAMHGADGVIDISPFTCMNGIVSEAVYPKLSRDYGNIPIRNFYFDGTESDLDRDIGIYMELAWSYRKKKRCPRQFPARFGQLAAGLSLPCSMQTSVSTTPVPAE